jgi:hypothetical protein
LIEPSPDPLVSEALGDPLVSEALGDVLVSEALGDPLVSEALRDVQEKRWSVKEQSRRIDKRTDRRGFKR